MVTEYVCLDVETTGLQPKTDKLIEIGAVKVRDGIAVEQFSTLIDPNMALPQRITALTGITDEMLCSAPQAEEVMPKFAAFCEDLPIMGHNVSFDHAFLKRAMLLQNLPFEKRGIDTLKIARKYLPELESRSLEYLCQYLEIKHTAHRALGDALATAQLYEWLKTQFYETAQKEESTVFSPRLLQHHVKKEQPITIAQKEQITKYCTALHIVPTEDIHSMTRAEASRFIEKYHTSYKGREMR